MSTELGKAYVQIVPTAKGISGSITKELSPETEAAGQKTGKGFAGKLAKGLAVGGAAIAAGSAAALVGIVKGAKGVSEYGDNVDKMSQKLGLSSDAYQKWDYVLNLAGTDMGSMTTGLKTLTNKFDDAKNGSEGAQEMFSKLGISMEDASKMSREDLFQAAINGLQGMEDTTERAALANDLFGKSGQNLAPLFNQSAKATKEQMALAEKYGMVMPEATVKASAAFQDSLTTMQGASTGLKNRLLGEFLPSMTKITDGLGKLFVGDMSGINDLSNGISGFAGKVGELSKKLLPIVAKTLSQIVTKAIAIAPKLLASGGKMLMSIASGIQGAMPTLTSKLPQLLSNALKAATKALPGVLDSGVQIISSLVSGALKALPKLTESIGTFIQLNLPTIAAKAGKLMLSIGKALITNLPAIVAAMFKLHRTIISSIATLAIKLIKSGLSMMKSLASGILRGVKSTVGGVLKGIWNAVKKTATTVFKQLQTVVTARMNAIKKSITTVWKAVKTWLSKTWTSIKSAASRVWTAIKNAVMRPINAAKSMLSGAWSAIRSAASAAWTKAKSTASTVWNAIKNAIYNPIKSAKSSLSSVVGAIKSALSNAWSNIKSKASSTWNAIKNAIQKPIMAAKSKVNSVVHGIKNAMGKLSSIKGKVSGIFKSIKDKITSPISSAKDKISSVISRIKSLFSGLHLTIPKPKIPKISVSGGKAPFGIGGKGSLPSFHVSWAASGGIMNRPTLFGGGEAGPEAILPLDPFWKRLDQMADNIVSGVATVAAANAGGGGDIHLDVYLYPSGPKMMEQIVKAYDTGKRRLG